MTRCFACSFAFAVSLFAADPAEAVRDAADAWTKAVVTQDKATLERLLADDLYVVDSSGTSVQTKSEYIASTTTGSARYEALTLRDVTIHVHGSSAVLSAFADAKPAGSEPFAIRFLQLYVQDSGKWKLGSSAATRVTAPAQRRANTGQPDAAGNSAAASVREAALGWTQAMVRRDKAALERWLSEDLIFVHSNGSTIQNKAQYLRASETSTYEALPMSNINVRVHGKTAVLTAYIDTKNMGREPFRVHTLQVFVENEGRWQLAAFQSTRVSPGTEGSLPHLPH